MCKSPGYSRVRNLPNDHPTLDARPSHAFIWYLPLVSLARIAALPFQPHSNDHGSGCIMLAFLFDPFASGSIHLFICDIHLHILLTIFDTTLESYCPSYLYFVFLLRCSTIITILTSLWGYNQSSFRLVKRLVWCDELPAARNGHDNLTEAVSSFFSSPTFQICRKFRLAGMAYRVGYGDESHFGIRPAESLPPSFKPPTTQSRVHTTLQL